MAPKPIVFNDLRGGRNDTDPPMELPMNQAVEFLNMDWKDATFGRKRGGATSLSLTGGTAFGGGGSEIVSLFRFVPGTDEASAQLFGTDGTGLTKRLTGGTSWADVTKSDTLTSFFVPMSATTLNGKLFIAYTSSAVDRLHVWDGSTIRRVGISPGTNAPTVANTGAGAYAATLRYYRVRFSQGNYNSSPVRISEPTPSVSFTPSGAGTAARITRPTAPGEGETLWIVEGSTDNSTFYILTEVAIATTTYDDTVAPSAYSAGTLSPTSGTFALVPSAKYVITDGNRLLMAGSRESGGATSADKNSRIWFTPVLGSLDKGDDERIPNTTTQKNWVDLNENDGGGVTGLGGPINGIPYAFKNRQIWKLRPTGDVTAPYLPRKIADGVGCISHQSIAVGEDHIGRPALYFMSHRGPYRITFDGAVEYLGRDNETTWRSVQLAATTINAHSVYYTDLHQWWLWVAVNNSISPDVKMILDVQRGFPDSNGQIRGGWAKHTGPSADANCSVMFSNTVGVSDSLDLKPYIGYGSSCLILKCDTSDTDDNGTDFQAYATTRPVLATADLGSKCGIGESTLLAKAASAQSVTVTINRDFGKETRAVTVSIAPAASETRVVKKVEGSEMGEADVVQMTVGDSAASDAVWTVDALITPVIPQEVR